MCCHPDSLHFVENSRWILRRSSIDIDILGVENTSLSLIMAAIQSMTMWKFTMLVAERRSHPTPYAFVPTVLCDNYQLCGTHYMRCMCGGVM